MEAGFESRDPLTAYKFINPGGYKMFVTNNQFSKIFFNRCILAVSFVFVLFLMNTTAQADCNPLQLVQAGNYYYYKGVDCEGFQWDIIFKDYFNDEWRMKKVRDNGGVEYFVGNRCVPSNGKRYAASACIYHSVQGDVISFVSQSWQDEKALTYNMTWHNDTRISGSEYWLGADRWDSYYFRTGYIDLIRGIFGGKSVGSSSQPMGVNEATNNVAGVPQEVWANEDDSTLKTRLEPDRYEAVKEMREIMGIE